MRILIGKEIIGERYRRVIEVCVGDTKGSGGDGDVLVLSDQAIPDPEDGLLYYDIIDKKLVGIPPEEPVEYGDPDTEIEKLKSEVENLKNEITQLKALKTP